MIKQARSAYFRQLISLNKNNPQTVFDTINNIVSPQMSQIQVYSASDCNKILMYFVNKVQDVRANICLSDEVQTINTIPPSHTWSTFSRVSLEDIQILLKKIKPSACPLDFIPTSLFLKVFDQIGPHLVEIINLSLQTGSVQTGDCKPYPQKT